MRAKEAYQANQLRVKELLAKVNAGLEANAKDIETRPNTINWGDADYLAYIAGELQTISDMLNREGEYA